MRDLVVLSGGLNSSMAICQSIGKIYHPSVYIYYMEGSSFDCLRHSKYVTECYDVKALDNEAIFEKLRKWTEAHDFTVKPLLFCSTDRACLFVAKYFDWLSNHFVLTTPTPDILEVYNSKIKTAEQTQQIRILAPKSKIVFKNTSFEDYSKDLIYPVIVKPVSAQEISSIGFKVKIVSDSATLRSLHNACLKEHNFVVQQYIPGGDNKSWFYIFFRDKNGIQSECIGKKILQHPSTQGVMAMGVTCKNPEIADICHDFLNKIQYEGIGGIEFKEYDGKYYFIEMSTRPEGFVKIAQSANPSLLPYIYSHMQTENEISSSSLDFKEGVYYIDLLLTFLEIKKSPKNLSKLLRGLFSGKVIFSLFSIHDLKPYFYNIKSLFN